MYDPGFNLFLTSMYGVSIVTDGFIVLVRDGAGIIVIAGILVRPISGYTIVELDETIVVGIVIPEVVVSEALDFIL